MISLNHVKSTRENAEVAKKRNIRANSHAEGAEERGAFRKELR